MILIILVGQQKIRWRACLQKTATIHFAIFTAMRITISVTDGLLTIRLSDCAATPEEKVLNWLSHAIGNKQVNPQIPTR